MAGSATPANLIVESITHFPGCCLDDLVRVCPTLTWNQIFLVVDQLSRAGDLRLILIGPGRYAVELPTDGRSRMRRGHEGPVRMPTLERQLQDAQCGWCSGLMVAGTYEDFRGRRCILCGERIDPVILARQRNPASPCLRTAQVSLMAHHKESHRPRMRILAESCSRLPVIPRLSETFSSAAHVTALTVCEESRRGGRCS